MAKYNQLLRIEEGTGRVSSLSGQKAFHISR
ncbi:MAG: hypothetical protein ACLR6B_10045 [Blautia sp.]